MENSENKGFKVEDKRRFDSNGGARDGVENQVEVEAKARDDAKTNTKTEGEGRRGEYPLPTVNFATFILSIAASAQVHLGLMPDPSTNEKKVSLPVAKHTIDTLEMLQEKTKGNLEAHEARLFDQILFELRMQYVEKQKK